MANFYQSFLRLQETVKLAEDQRLSLTTTAATGYLTQENLILSDGIPFDVFDANLYNSSLGATRALASQFLNSFGGELAGVLAELSKVIAPAGVGVPPTAPTQVLPLLYQFMVLNQAPAMFLAPPLLVNSRNITRGAPVYGTNVGNGTLYRLNVDAYGFPLEGGYAERLNMLCSLDNQSGTIVGQEQFTVLGQPFRDALTWLAPGFGSGISALGASGLVGVTAETTQALAQNPSFSQSTGTGATANFALTGWTLLSGLPASMSLDTVNFYRAAQSEGATPASLSATATVSITQRLSSNAGALALTAYLSQLAVNFTVGGGTGSVTVQIGSKSWTVLSGGPAGWNLLLPPLDKNLWFINFNAANLAVTITITRTAGTIKVDDFCWSPMVNLGGTLFWLIGGSVPFLVNDTISTTDIEPSPPSKLQNWIRFMFPGYFLPSAVLPAAPATPATLVQSGAAGVVTAGAHLGYVSFLGAGAINSAIGVPSAIVTVDGTKQINWSAIPVGPGGTTARRLWRTKAGGTKSSDTPFLVATIPDNVTVVFADNVADAALVQMPTSYGDPA